MIGRPSEGEFAPFYAGYVARVPEAEALAVLEGQTELLRAQLATVSADRECFRYAPGKWTIRELVGHVIDAERVFGYRAFCISRGDRAALPGFDENQYLAASSYSVRGLAGLIDELALVRQANLAVFRDLDERRWLLVGNAASSPVSVRALAFILAGHMRHHTGVLAERYRVAPPPPR